MKELDGALKKENTKPASLVQENRNKAIPKKVFASDYEIIREYAFHNDITMIETTERILDFLEEQNIRDYNDYFKNTKERSEEVKSMRMSKAFFQKIKKINHITRIPMLQVISFCIEKTITNKQI